jgi:hypothetical protein
MAGDDHDISSGVVGRLTNTAQAELGLWHFLVSKVLWVLLGWHAHAYALIALQLGLCALNVRGAMKNEPHSSPIRRENSVRGVRCAPDPF